MINFLKKLNILMQIDKKVSQVEIIDPECGSIEYHDLLCDKSYLHDMGTYGVVLDDIYNDVLYIFGININRHCAPPSREVLKNRVECIKEFVDLSDTEIGRKNQKLIRNLEFMLSYPEKAGKELNRPIFILNN